MGRKKEIQGEGDREQRKMKSESTCTVTLPICKLYINAALPRCLMCLKSGMIQLNPSVDVLMLLLCIVMREG